MLPLRFTSVTGITCDQDFPYSIEAFNKFNSLAIPFIVSRLTNIDGETQSYLAPAAVALKDLDKEPEQAYALHVTAQYIYKQFQDTYHASYEWTKRPDLIYLYGKIGSLLTECYIAITGEPFKFNLEEKSTIAIIKMFNYLLETLRDPVERIQASNFYSGKSGTINKDKLEKDQQQLLEFYKEQDQLISKGQYQPELQK